MTRLDIIRHYAHFNIDLTKLSINVISPYLLSRGTTSEVSGIYAVTDTRNTISERKRVTGREILSPESMGSRYAKIARLGNMQHGVSRCDT